jgi:glycosyltransferase involved in cell wall biosynthesis
VARLKARAQAVPIRGDLHGADLVVAESLEAADAAVRAGVPGRRVWALALPIEWLRLGDDSPYAELLARVAPQVGGLLTDTEPARDSVERAAAGCRPRIMIFPPLAVDRPCPSCANVASPSVAEDAPPEVVLLRAWRLAIDPAANDPAYSFALARLRGLAGPWAPAQRPNWTQASATSPQSGPVGAPAAAWTADAQVRAARALLELAAPSGSVAGWPRRPRRTLVSGYDLKFIRELAGHLDARPDLNVTLDEWAWLTKGTRQTERLAGAAESIVAEWARPSAVWLSRHKRPDQRLIVRLHRFELDAPYPRDIDIDAVDAVVHVSPPIRRRILDELGWPTEKLVYIPNFVDTDWLNRPKLPGARFGIGFVGLEFANKRFDLALDVLAEVRRFDPRFTLFVRSRMPWDNEYAWDRSDEREFAGWCLARIEQDPLLRGAVVFEQPGRDMARWYRRVGHVVSMSDIESFHLSAAEGMASGAVPVIRPWPGSAEIYDKEWIHSSVDDAAAAILASADEEAWAERAARARAEICRTANPAGVVQAWADLLHGNTAAARAQFEAYLD